MLNSIDGDGKVNNQTPKIKKTYNPYKHESLPKDLEQLIPAWAITFNSKLTFEN
ncbi:MAG: hypothetical protein WA667_29255 [Candidatus Nitrosopolaris sp.]